MFRPLSLRSLRWMEQWNYNLRYPKSEQVRSFIVFFLLSSITTNLFIFAFHSRIPSFLSVSGSSCGSRFNALGTRLLCSRIESQLTVYDLPTLLHESFLGTGQTALKDSEFTKEDVGYDSFCFAGLDDELVISGSDDHNLHIWSLPDANGQDCTVNRSLRILRGHEDSIHCVRSSPDRSSLISCADDGVIKLWTPTDGSSLRF